MYKTHISRSILRRVRPSLCSVLLSQSVECVRMKWFCLANIGAHWFIIHDFAFSAIRLFAGIAVFFFCSSKRKSWTDDKWHGMVMKPSQYACEGHQHSPIFFFFLLTSRTNLRINAYCRHHHMRTADEYCSVTYCIWPNIEWTFSAMMIAYTGLCYPIHMCECARWSRDVMLHCKSPLLAIMHQIA